MHTYGKIGCCSFAVAGILHLCTTVFICLYLHPVEVAHQEEKHTIGLHYITVSSFVLLAVSCLISRLLFQEQHYQIVWRSLLLGIGQAFGITIALCCSANYTSLGWYILIMSFFHFSEFVVTSVIRPQNLSLESFLLNHSKAYGIAALISWIEYWTEFWLFPGFKNAYWISMLGLLLCIGGEVLRKTAMLTAFHNFDHLIRTRREEQHQLVTTGIYSLCRHPSYVGWFYWSIGTQIILCNPLCAVAYTFASWKFFHERVFEEEVTLLHFFGRDYVAYQSKVPTGLPFIHGYNM
ncbi:protein-S-isoprenylcysteine O-methyltransferase-like [Daphnia pulex]|uniref:Protein-S-isoprenylcysteine O-methyltransferase n=1 Tax=Daphnia pulex TaxID=6669 RepID=A0A4Y7MUI2_DAPPU|nr:protein-S-isoprenylcysteine O-methyltransferase-like [Daphnia pulex]XP_046653892.1 protein-S-isoprenylcysteine O-methyltransferase-like [Daphnia pulicaria]SVE84483.1 EOG090X0CFU [Daphnia pulex]